MANADTWNSFYYLRSLQLASTILEAYIDIITRRIDMRLHEEAKEQGIPIFVNEQWTAMTRNGIERIQTTVQRMRQELQSLFTRIHEDESTRSGIRTKVHDILTSVESRIAELNFLESNTDVLAQKKLDIIDEANALNREYTEWRIANESLQANAMELSAMYYSRSSS